MQHAIAQLRRAIAKCGDFPVFVVTPWTRRNLNKQKFQLRKCLAPATVLDGVQLVCGENSTMEKKEKMMRAGWASDPMHIYAKMALNLIEKVAPAADTTGASVPGNRKRTWSESNREDGESSSSRHWQPDSRSSYGRQGRSDGGNGSANSWQRQHDSRNSSYGGSGSSRVSNRSAAWKAGEKSGGYSPAGKRGGSRLPRCGGGGGFGGFAGRGGYRYN
jgi:hypothetical protein